MFVQKKTRSKMKIKTFDRVAGNLWIISKTLSFVNSADGIYD